MALLDFATDDASRSGKDAISILVKVDHFIILVDERHFNWKRIQNSFENIDFNIFKRNTSPQLETNHEMLQF